MNVQFSSESHESFKSASFGPRGRNSESSESCVFWKLFHLRRSRKCESSWLWPPYFTTLKTSEPDQSRTLDGLCVVNKSRWTDESAGGQVANAVHLNSVRGHRKALHFSRLCLNVRSLLFCWRASLSVRVLRLLRNTCPLVRQNLAELIKAGFAHQ